MDSNRYVRSRTSSTSSLPATPAHTPNTATLSRSSHGVFSAYTPIQPFSVSPDLLAANLSRIRAEQGSRGSSIPPTPAPTPNLLIQNHMIPEQLVAGIKQLRADEGYIESSSFPATPAPSPFSPSPGQFLGFSPDQVAESIRRLREEDSVSAHSEVSTGQPPTPSTTPGPVLAHQIFVPERLAESIQHLRCDEGLDSTSNPATPIPTPISPLFLQHGQRAHQILPEQLAAGIHRLKVEEGMSSGGSSGFPSTPAPTPFTFHPGGVRPEDLAAGISRLSVIEEGESLPSQTNQQQKVSIRVVMDESADSVNGSQPNLSQYFSDALDLSASTAVPSVSFFDQLSETSQAGPNFFDQLSVSNANQTATSSAPATSTSDSFFDNPTNQSAADEAFNQNLDDTQETAVLHSCRPSRVDLPSLDNVEVASEDVEAKIEVTEQTYDDAKSLQRRQSHEGKSPSDTAHPMSHGESPLVCNIFSASNVTDPFESILSGTNQSSSGEQRPNPPTSLPTIAEPGLLNTTPGSLGGSLYATPIAPSPMGDNIFGYSMKTSTPQNPPTMSPFNSGMPITSPLPNAIAAVALPPTIANLHDSVSNDDGELFPEIVRRRDAWIPSGSTRRVIDSVRMSRDGSFYPERSLLTLPSIHFRENLQDPVRNLISHYRGESEATKRTVLTADSVSQDERGLRQLIDSGCYRSAINLTTRLLQEAQQGQQGVTTKHSPYTLNLWYTRLALFVKLKQFSNAEVEAEAFGDLDRADLYWEYYPEMDPLRRGSLVPFNFRILISELPQHLGKHHEALDRLYALLATVDQMLSNLRSGQCEDGGKGQLTPDDKSESISFWSERRLRIIYSLANCAISQKDFDLAFTTLEMLFVSEDPEKKAKIKSALGRVFLQLGDLVSAGEQFEVAKSLRAGHKTDNSSVQSDFETENLLDATFMAIASNNYIEALGHLEAANVICPGNPIIINNISVCLLYLGRLKDAIGNLESNLTANPALFLQESPVLNLATLYELESSFAGQKKLALLDLMSQFVGDGVNTTCLKF